MDFPDLKEEDVGPTRGDRRIDRIFGNLACVEDAGTVPPLETDRNEAEEVFKSNHMIAYLTAKVQRTQPYEMMTYKYRYYNRESEAEFGWWLSGFNWNELLSAEGSNKKTEIYQREIVAAQERYFPLITVRRRSTDPPWYNWKIRKRIA